MPDVEFFGEKFELAGEPSEFALMEFAEAADSGAGTNHMRSMAAMLRLVFDCLEPGPDGEAHALMRAETIRQGNPDPGAEMPEHRRFREVARRNRAKTEQLMDIFRQAMERQAERPTGQPSDSSDGPPVTVLKSVSSLEGKVEAAFPGRPELQAGFLEMAHGQTG